MDMMIALKLRSALEYKSFIYLTKNNGISSGTDLFTAATTPSSGCRCDNLTFLDMQHFCTNEFMYHMMDNNNLPRLKTLKCRRSLPVTDLGLEYLSRSSCRDTLQVVDITYCRNTTYQGTFPLRKRLTSLRLLRRQPEWLDGHFLTPFGGGGKAEADDDDDDLEIINNNNDDDDDHKRQIHTYYPDGTFSFSRYHQLNGFVCDLYEYPDDGDDSSPSTTSTSTSTSTSSAGGGSRCSADLVFDKLQYNNFRGKAGWPQWFRYCYRPGITLLYLPSTSDNTDNSTDDDAKTTPVTTTTATEQKSPRCVLVGQRLSGIRPLRERSLMEAVKDSISIGESRFYNQNGREIRDIDNVDEGIIIEDENDRTTGVVMISKMKVLPLSEEELLPPAELVEACRVTCEDIEAFRTAYLARLEEELNISIERNT